MMFHNMIGLFLCMSYMVVYVQSNFIGSAWMTAIKQTLYEQEVEDLNAVHKIDNHLARRLIVMPLTDAFNPNQANAMFGKVQYGDKCSLPSSLGRLIFEKPYEVPWIFEVKKVIVGETAKLSSSISSNTTNAASVVTEGTGQQTSLPIAPPNITLDKAYISPLDFRSPENYIFMPRWLMKSMNLKSNDLVDVTFVRIKLAGLIIMQPLSLEWDKLVEKNKNPQTVLEHEVNKYSSLTAGSTILIEVDGVEYPFHVKETKAESGVSVKGVRVQDSDVKVDFDRTYLDNQIKLKKIKEKEREKEKEKESEEKRRRKKSKNNDIDL